MDPYFEMLVYSALPMIFLFIVAAIWMYFSVKASVREKILIPIKQAMKINKPRR